MQKVLPAILTEDPVYLKEKLKLFEGECEWLHIDIMDGMFVPTFSVPVLELGNAHEHFNFEMHLMVADPEAYFEDCEKVGAKRVIFHVEAPEQPEEVLKRAKHYSFQTGIALSPGTGVEQVSGIPGLEVAVPLGAVPGFQGQRLIPSTLEAIPELKKHIPLVGFDGGVAEENIREIFAKGADYVVAGSAIVRTPDPVASFKKLLFMAE